jgi:hypothetical protein
MQNYKCESILNVGNKKYKEDDIHWFHYKGGSGGYCTHNARISHIDVDKKQITLDYSIDYYAKKEIVDIYDIVDITDIKP